MSEVPAPAPDHLDVVVIGAGPAGLLAASSAAARGARVEVVERGERVGGLAASFEVAGQRVDLGSHRLHPATPPALLARLADLLGDDLQRRPRHGRIRLSGRWVGFPLRTGDLVRNLPPRFAAGAALDAVRSPFRRARDDTFGAVLEAGLGPTVAGTFYAPYAEKLWGLAPDELDGELARRRVASRGPADIARRLVSGARPEGRTFWYPRLGFGQIADVLADEARALGVVVRTGAAVTGLRRRAGDGWEVALADGSVRTCRHVWSSAPVTALLPLLDPAPPADVAAAAAGLRHRGMAFVYLVVPRPQVTPFDAHYLPGPESVASRVSEPKNYRDGPDPADRSVLCAEVPCAAGDARWATEDDALVARVAGELRALGLDLPADVEGEVVRVGAVYPVYDRGFAERLAVVEDWVGGRAGLVTFGRQGLFVPDNTHHVLAMGEALAACLRDDGSFDRAAWEARRRGFGDHVVED